MRSKDMGRDRDKLHTTLDRLREITVANDNERRDLLAELIVDIEKHLDKPINVRHTVVGLKRAHRDGFREGLVLMGLVWLLAACMSMVCGCFSDNGDGPDAGTATDSSATSSAGTSGATTGPASGDDSGSPSGTESGTATTGASSGSTGTATGSTGASGGETTGWPDDDYYGPCSELGGCGIVIEECLHHYNGDICGAGCVTAADCPPPPPGQEVSCRDVDYSLPGEECVLVCTGTWDESTCEPPTHCVSVNNGTIKYCVYPA
jgi:hypothetical protein